MQRSNTSKSVLSKLVGASVLAASVAFVPLSLPATAQTNSAPDTTTTTGQDVEAAEYDDNDSFDWGWLGLLGLGGLAGLAGRKRNDDVRYREGDEARTTNYGR